jgi:hypothetical protein
MIQTINKNEFGQAFKQAGRSEQFSYAALGALFDYFEEYEESTGQPIELDVVAICCEYSEETASEIAGHYSIDMEGLDEIDVVNAVRTYLNENTLIVSEDDDVFVYQQF